ncbi:S1C family serine protease [Rhodanobacter sp. FW106-PBR-LB-2-11]|uniref:S1C family serine protease n=1 Tax=Rhodanobacter sp. FW106-PBR-LB-2-11 TaxID=1524463 RepID=UPI0034E42416
MSTQSGGFVWGGLALLVAAASFASFWLGTAGCGNRARATAKSPGAADLLVAAAAVGGRSTVSIIGDHLDDASPAAIAKAGLAARAARGAGVVVGAAGEIVTCAHVVAGANVLLVRFPRGSGEDVPLRATVLGVDTDADLALLRVHPEHRLNAASWADSANVRPGQQVIAIGAPYGFEGTVTEGVVSATSRDLKFKGRNPVRFIQSDVPEAPGNSGGPLFDLAGRIVGINAQIFEADHGSSMPLSFAIPSDVVQRVVARLRRRAQ